MTTLDSVASYTYQTRALVRILRRMDSLSSPSASPDGRRVVGSRTVQGKTDIWLLDGGRTSRLTFDAAGHE